MGASPKASKCGSVRCRAAQSCYRFMCAVRVTTVGIFLQIESVFFQGLRRRLLFFQSAGSNNMYAGKTVMLNRVCFARVGDRIIEFVQLEFCIGSVCQGPGIQGISGE